MALGGLGRRSAETLKDIAFAVTEKKTEPQTERTEAKLTCKRWRKDELGKRNLQIGTEDVMEKGDGMPSLIRDKENEELQGSGFCSYNALFTNCGKRWTKPAGLRSSPAAEKELGLPGRIRVQRKECLTTSGKWRRYWD